VCDVAVPQDADPDLRRDRPDVHVLRGGLLKPPLHQHLSIRGLPLQGGQLYGCVAETILLGATGIRGSLSHGPLTPAKVRWIRELAAQHGWRVEEEISA
jgi:predicted amino acid dehydrogenase